MKETLKPVYYCEYCGKHGLRKHSMLHHESLCLKNPENIRPCIECLNFTKKMTTVNRKTDFDEKDFHVYLFYCKAKNVFLYTPQNEIKGNQFQIKEQNVPMPKECELYEPFEAFEFTDYDDF